MGIKEKCSPKISKMDASCLSELVFLFEAVVLV